MIFIIVGLCIVLVGILLIINGKKFSNFTKTIKNGNMSNYKMTKGIVICNGYSVDDMTDIPKNVTPIVEYEVNGKKYEACNQILSSDGELPVGTIVRVWYKINNPQRAILGSSESSNVFFDIIGVIVILVGIYFIMLGI